MINNNLQGQGGNKPKKPQEELDDANEQADLNQGLERNSHPWTDIGLIALALYCLYHWGKALLWLIKRWKLTIPISIFFILSILHGCNFALNPHYRAKLDELAEEQKQREKGTQ